jgi:hypothetical protein
MNASRSYVYAVARACDQGKISRRVSSPDRQSSSIDLIDVITTV